MFKPDRLGTAATAAAGNGSSSDTTPSHADCCRCCIALLLLVGLSDAVCGREPSRDGGRAPNS
jgi:hypothetical protein